MGIFDALTTAVAGLQAQSYALQNISGNIANSQTTGYKETDTSFQDLVSAAAAQEQTSGGVIATSVSTNTVQGSIQSTSVPTDMAINGDGFFVVQQPTSFTDNQPDFSGVNNFTRAGDFQLNDDGYLVNGAGYYLMGIPVNAETGNPEGSVPQVLQFDNNFVPAQATTDIQYQANLPATPSVGLINPDDFEANPLAGANQAASIVGTGATLQPDAAASGTGSVNLTTPTEAAGNLVVATGGTSYTIAIAADESLSSIETAINGTAGLSSAVTASDDGAGHLILTTTGSNADVNTITLSGTAAAGIGFGAGNDSFSPTNLLTQSAVAQGQTLTVTSGGNTQTITFGTGANQVATLAQLQTAIQGLPTDTPPVAVNGTVNTANGNITLTAQNPTATITIGGTATASKFGIQNLSAYPADGTVIGNDLTTFNAQSVDGGSITAYDSEGNPVNVDFRWAQVSNSGGTATWQLFYQTNSNATGSQPAWQNVGTTFTFNSSGQLNPPITSLQLQNLTVNGDNLGAVQLQFGSNGLTQFASTSGTAQVNQIQQNGFAAGQLQSVAVDSQGRITGTFSNGQTIPLAEIPLATFNGEDSLQALNGGAYAATAESGAPIYDGSGTIEGSSLESSNVDISTQFSDLIVAQQAYSANARVMSTADQMIQSLLQVIQ